MLQINVFSLVVRTEIDAWTWQSTTRGLVQERFLLKSDEQAVNSANTKSEGSRNQLSRSRLQCQCPCHGHANGCQNDRAFSEYSPLIQRANFPTTVGTFSWIMVNGILYFHSTENTRKHQHPKHPQRVMADITSVAIDPEIPMTPSVSVVVLFLGCIKSFEQTLKYILLSSTIIVIGL